MSSVSKKCKNSEENNKRDRLTELPDELIVHILSLMPTPDAIRTVLLRRFGNLWTMIPSLKFKDREILKRLLNCGTSNRDLITCFSNYVDRVLSLHKSPTIHELDLRLYKLDWLGNRRPTAWRCWTNMYALGDIRKLVNFAIGKEVKVLAIEFIDSRREAKWKPPCSVFASKFLVELKLDNVFIIHLDHVEMVSLKTLSLTNFSMCDEVFNKLISGCPSLKLLQIENQYNSNELRITSPSIEELELEFKPPCLLDCPNLKVLDISLCGIYVVPNVVDVSSLREVVIWSPNSAQEINKLVNMFCKVDVFELCDNDSMPLQLNHHDLPQTRWKHLHITSLLHNEEQLLSICSMLRSSPHLEELELDVEYTPVNHKDCTKLKLELPPPFAMPLLKIVTLRDYVVSCQGLIRVVEFLLKSATVLEKIVIVPKEYEPAAIDELEFVKKLSGLLIASTTKVIFGSNVY